MCIISTQTLAHKIIQYGYISVTYGITHVLKMNDSTESNRQLSSSVHGPGCKSDPSSSRIAAVRRLFNDGGVEVILFFFSALQSSVL